MWFINVHYKKIDLDIVTMSVRSFYNHQENGHLGIKAIDMPRKAKYKKRKHKKMYKYSNNNNIIRKGRTYADFLIFRRENKIFYYSERDLVGVTTKYGYKGCIFSLAIPDLQFVLLFKIENKETSSIVAVMRRLRDIMGIKLYRELFTIILFDKGSEFNDYIAIETDEEGEIISRVFYCDPLTSFQKPHVEGQNATVRSYIPKGTNCKNYTQEDCDYIASMINSIPGDKLATTPYELTKQILGKEVLDKLNIKYIDKRI